MRPRSAFTVVELMISLSIFVLMSIVLVIVLKNVTDLWRQADAKDDVVRALMKARGALSRDLLNASSRPNQVAVARVGPHGGPGFDGEALSFLSSDEGNNLPEWSLDASGHAQPRSQITYFLVVPAGPYPNGVAVAGGPADSNGFEQQNPFKWLIRRVDPAASGFQNGWTGWLTQPGSAALPAGQQLVARNLLGFRVLKTGPLWSLELSAVAIKDAQKRLALGQVPLAHSSFTITERFSVRTNNP